MKFCLTLGLLLYVCGATGEHRINLDDIERDNLRAEGVPKSGNTRLDEPKYLAKFEIGQQQYRAPSQYHGPTSGPVAYVTPSSSLPNAPPPDTYARSNKYAVKEQAHQQQNDVLPEQILPPRYYDEYQQQQQQPAPAPKGVAPNVYEPQQLVYQPEVTVGNQLQAVQQKTITAKYAKNLSKGPVYVDIPTMHLFAYYPNLNVNTEGTGGLLLPRLATAATEHISIPFYTSSLSQKPIAPGKPVYRVQYAPKYNTVDPPTIYPAKIAKIALPGTPVPTKPYTGSPLAGLPTYVPSDQSSAQGRQFLYTQAYIGQPQPRYVSRLVYAQPTTVYMHATPVYSDAYARPPVYVQDNSLPGSVKYTLPVEQLDSATQIVDELPGEIPTRHNNVGQHYDKDPEEPSSDLIPPQVPAQQFKSETTPLLPVPSQDEESISEQNHVGLSEPRSLLDSYVPSKLIAAQDSARYQERPIKLESGFLPSKENFAQKKRKAN